MKKTTFGWGNGGSDLLMEVKNGAVRLLDVEFDGEELHKLCGGKTYYVSCSGASGAGYFNTLGSLIKVGSYRVDTAYNEFQEFLPVGRNQDGEVLVAVPYVSHQEDKSETLRSYPTVVKIGLKVVYCDFEVNFLEVLSLILSGKDLPGECESGGRSRHRTFKKTFTRLNSWGEIVEEEVLLEHYNLCSMERTPNPWEFFQRELEDYQSEDWWKEERILQLLSVERLENGTFVRTVRFDNIRYRGEILPAGDPLKGAGDLPAGWQRATDDVLVRFYDRSNEAHLAAFAKADEVYGKLARRLANKMGEGEEFISFVSAHEGEYIEYEQVEPKLLYLLDPAAKLAEARKGLAKKVREDVFSRARQWVEEVNDQSLLEAIPENLIVTIDDSLEAGNCLPGTEAFIARYFPGQTHTTAGELKHYADNYSVMRIFRYLAKTGRFKCELKAFSA